MAIRSRVHLYSGACCLSPAAIPLLHRKRLDGCSKPGPPIFWCLLSFPCSYTSFAPPREDGYSKPGPPIFRCLLSFPCAVGQADFEGASNTLCGDLDGFFPIGSTGAIRSTGLVGDKLYRLHTAKFLNSNTADFILKSLSAREISALIGVKVEWPFGAGSTCIPVLAVFPLQLYRFCTAKGGMAIRSQVHLCSGACYPSLVLSDGPTLKVSAIHCVATSMDSFPSGPRVPSVVDVLRTSYTGFASPNFPTATRPTSF